MNKINAKRLENLARAAAEADPKNFDMEVYGTCGTPGCVLGHYAARRDLQRTFKFTDTAIFCGKTLYWVHHEHQDVLEHFGITWKQARQLMDPDGCNKAKTPKQAAAYIRRFIRKNLKAR